jgi:hypothetical protein
MSTGGNAAYDGRDDKTTPITVDYIVTDTFPGGTAVTPRYSEDRVRLDGGADYALFRRVRLGLQPYHHNVSLFALTVRYELGSVTAGTPKEE